MDNLDPVSYAQLESQGQFGTTIPIRLFSMKIYGVTGVPPATLGAETDIAIRTDGTLGAFIYQRRGGSWVATSA